jgi:hypothetical protein
VVLEPVLISDIVAKGHDFAAYNWLADPQTDGFEAVSVVIDGTLVTDRYFRFAIAIDYYATDQLMISGTTQFYAPTAAAGALLARWQETIVAIPGTLDDGCLAYAFNNTDADRFGLRPYWLPKAYARYPWWITERPVNDHPESPSQRDDHAVWSAHCARTGKDRVYLHRTSLRPPSRPCNAGYVVDTREKIVLCIDATGTLVPVGKSNASFWLPHSGDPQRFRG